MSISNPVVAVYGTLRVGTAKGDLLVSRGRVKPVGKSHFKGTLYDLGAFPGLRLEGETLIWVDLLELRDENVLHDLDLYEGYMPDNHLDSLYLRKLLPCGVYVYVFNQSLNGAKEIVCGDWLQYLAGA